MIFAKMKNGGLQLCVDYRAPNRATVKHRYPLPLISEMLDRLHGARTCTKLDLRNAYHIIRINEAYEYKTPFRTRYSQFKYQVMLSGLTTAPATFQAYIEDCIQPFIDDIVVCYLDNILIYSTDQEEHARQVRKVVKRLREFCLYAKADKCHFGVTEVAFLGFVLRPQGIGIDMDHISMLEDWPTPETVQDVEARLGFTNFYQRCISIYAKVTKLI
jgi:hypothetical protein